MNGRLAHVVSTRFDVTFAGPPIPLLDSPLGPDVREDLEGRGVPHDHLALSAVDERTAKEAAIRRHEIDPQWMKARRQTGTRKEAPPETPRPGRRRGHHVGITQDIAPPISRMRRPTAAPRGTPSVAQGRSSMAMGWARVETQRGQTITGAASVRETEHLEGDAPRSHHDPKPAAR